MSAEYFLRIDGIPGGSLDDKHHGEIEIESWGFVAEQTGAGHYGSGAGAGRLRVEDLRFTMPINKASPELFLACSTGRHLPKVILSCREATGPGRRDHLQWTFEDVLVSRYETGGGYNGEKLKDRVSLNFSRALVTFIDIQPDGSAGGGTRAGYDIAADKRL